MMAADGAAPELGDPGAPATWGGEAQFSVASGSPQGMKWLAVRQESAVAWAEADGLSGSRSKDASVQYLFIEYAPPTSKNDLQQ